MKTSKAILYWEDMMEDEDGNFAGIHGGTMDIEIPEGSSIEEAAYYWNKFADEGDETIMYFPTREEATKYAEWLKKSINEDGDEETMLGDRVNLQ